MFQVGINERHLTRYVRDLHARGLEGPFDLDTTVARLAKAMERAEGYVPRPMRLDRFVQLQTMLIEVAPLFGLIEPLPSDATTPDAIRRHGR